MGKNKEQGFVQHITPRNEDFSQWYTDVILQADLVDYCLLYTSWGAHPL